MAAGVTGPGIAVAVIATTTVSGMADLTWTKDYIDLVCGVSSGRTGDQIVKQFIEVDLLNTNEAVIDYSATVTSSVIDDLCFPTTSILYDPAHVADYTHSYNVDTD